MPVPGEQFVDVTGWMVGDAGQHVGDIELRIEAIELGALDQRVHRGGAVAASVGAGEEIVLATDGDTAQGALGRVVVERQRPSSKHRTSAGQRARM